MKLSQKMVAEAIGTFALTFIGITAICMNVGGLVGVALAHGLAIAVMVSAMGHISGGHFNPAVTIGLMAGGKIKTNDTIAYIIAQLGGAVLAAAAAKAVLPPLLAEGAKLGTPIPAPGIEYGPAILAEIILTFFLVLVVYGTAVDQRAPKVGGLFIGLTVTLDILAAGPITGASMNPARTFGPALIGGYWEMHLVSWVGPLIGGVLAGVVYPKFLGKEGM
ncbi:MAG TPA: MIP family channel protein [Bacteroidota bacterium]|nr:MIP family channel protein [Bacteroidota bacterium]